MLKKLSKKDLNVDNPVEWPVYASSGRLLLHPGQYFHSDQLIEVLLWRGLFRGNKSTFESGDYEENVEITTEEFDEYESEKERRNFNDDFSALADQQSGNDSLFQGNPDDDLNLDNNAHFGDDFSLDEGEEETNNESNSKQDSNLAIQEKDQQRLVNEIKTDVLKTVRAELEDFFKNSFKDQIQNAIKKGIRDEIQDNVVKQLGKKIDVKIKKEVNTFIENEYGRENKNPINRLIVISSQLDLIYTSLEECSPESANSILNIATDIQDLCAQFPDAMLMSIHLYNKGSYTIRHPIDMAILSELVAMRRGIKDINQRKHIVAAALTCDFAMRELQKTLQTQSAPLNDKQREEINYHTVQGVALLLSAGINDPVWLDTVAQHHERIDGSGYPLQYTSEQICEGAKILAVCDRYSAMVTGRSYRVALHGKDALSIFLSEEDKIYEKNIIVMLINELSIYPPGTFVQLQNGEFAVVTRRGGDASKHSKIQPRVLSFANADGTELETPVVRECKIKKYSVKETVFWDKPFRLTPEKICQICAETKE